MQWRIAIVYLVKSRLFHNSETYKSPKVKVKGHTHVDGWKHDNM